MDKKSGYNLIIIGGGASGMTAAIYAARNGLRDIAVIERNSVCGKKLNATGNGKCNFSNTDLSIRHFRSNSPEKVNEILSVYGGAEAIEFFKSIGILTKLRNGYCYPMSEQAASVRNALENEVRRLGIKIYNDIYVRAVKSSASRYEVIAENIVLSAKKIIIATGGCSSPVFGSDGSGYGFCKGLGHSIIRPLPALVQLCLNEARLKTVSGVRFEGTIALYSENSLLSEERGELLFTQYGISGIPAMQLSRYAAIELDRKKRPFIIIDALPELSRGELYDYITERLKICPGSIEDALNGLINNKLLYFILLKCNIKPSGHVSGNQIFSVSGKLTDMLKKLELEVCATNGFENSQVTCGGIPLSEIDSASMESKLAKGVYITGELLDVDGTCGGYNLQWAWSTGAVAGKSVAGELHR